MFRSAALAAVLAGALLAGPTAAQAAPSSSQSPVATPAQLPVPFDLGAGLRAMAFPETPPPGANDPNCRPSPQHPNPVVLVNPTFATQASAWQAGAPFLRNLGYCVYTFNFGNPTWISEIPIQGVGDIRQSAQVLSATVDRVLATTGATKVDLVGHSQGGGVLPGYYLNVLGGAAKVDRFVGVSPSNHGTTASELAYVRSLVPPVGRAFYDALGALAPALTQQAIDSDLMRQTYARGDTRPGVHYTTIVTKYDEVVTPYDQQFLNGPDVTNILLQDGCPSDRSEHLSTLYSERVWLFVANALDPAHATAVPCFEVDPFFPNVR
ncbi:alpha/beta fold hydrolase [Rhodococcus sp. D2-41]|uniref:Triacylglycerol lipase n=1 Tax=Speluncibacter jeojiensis TaxID=2710754 RepID=A0A9X4M4B0_9ACTN|nr:alpha/beta fold hydrolase [Rhodococcus sp. D2-41]MDG3008910.1 alpha/beta fold hydrolase [Rhodococcus sp. D2-41]MDG3016532.1 triacylglycerol lipase [Corynebacteriales bacterium D3-21]